MDEVEAWLLVAGGAVIVLAVVAVIVLPALGAKPSGSVDTGGGSAADID